MCEQMDDPLEQIIYNELILENIFRNLNLQDQLSLTFVCRAFQDVMWKLWRKSNATFKINKNIYSWALLATVETLQTARNCIYLEDYEHEDFLRANKDYIMAIEYTEHEYRMNSDPLPLSVRYSNVQKVVLTCPYVNEHMLNCIKVDCQPKLKEIIINDISSWEAPEKSQIAASDIGSLEKATLCDNHCLSKEEFYRLLFKLKYFCLQGTDIIHSRYADAIVASNANRTDIRLETLKIHKPHIDLVFRLPKGIVFNNLMELCIDASCLINQQLFEKIVQTCPILKILHFRMIKFKINVIPIIKSLQELQLVGCEGFNQELLNQILTKFHLESLKLMLCFFGECHQLLNSQETTSCLGNSLKKLSICCRDSLCVPLHYNQFDANKKFWFNTLQNGSNSFENLGQLIINDYNNCQFDRFLSVVAKRVPHLKQLTIEDSYLKNVDFAQFSGLENLIITDCYNYNLSELLLQVYTLPHLQSLTIFTMPNNVIDGNAKKSPFLALSKTDTNNSLQHLYINYFIYKKFHRVFLYFLKLNFTKQLEFKLKCSIDPNTTTVLKKLIRNPNVMNNLKVFLLKASRSELAKFYVFFFDPFIRCRVYKFLFNHHQIDLSWTDDKIKHLVFGIKKKDQMGHHTIVLFFKCN